MKNSGLTFILIVVLSLMATGCKSLNNNSLGKTKTSPSNNDNYVYLEDIKVGKELDRASITSDAKYFDYVMSNELGNPKGKPVYETDLYLTS